MSLSLQKRIEALEEQVARLEKGQAANGSAGRLWLEDLYGAFAGDAIFEQAMNLGRKYRRSLRPRRQKSAQK